MSSPEDESEDDFSQLANEVELMEKSRHISRGESDDDDDDDDDDDQDSESSLSSSSSEDDDDDEEEEEEEEESVSTNSSQKSSKFPPLLKKLDSLLQQVPEERKKDEKKNEMEELEREKKEMEEENREKESLIQVKNQKDEEEKKGGDSRNVEEVEEPAPSTLFTNSDTLIPIFDLNSQTIEIDVDSSSSKMEQVLHEFIVDVNTNSMPELDVPSSSSELLNSSAMSSKELMDEIAHRPKDVNIRGDYDLLDDGTVSFPFYNISEECEHEDIVEPSTSKLSENQSKNILVDDNDFEDVLSQFSVHLSGPSYSGPPSQASQFNSNESEDDDDELDVEIDEEDIPVSYQNAKILNESYQNTLKEILDNLYKTLNDNRKRQEIIKNEIDDLKNSTEHIVNDNDPVSGSITRCAITVFYAPYFKDVRMFTHPDNPDTKKKKELGEPDVFSTYPPRWTKIDKNKLVKVVYEDAIHSRLKNLLDNENELKFRIRNQKVSSDLELKNMEEQLEIIEAKKKEIYDTPSDEIFHNRDEDFDWLKIATQSFRGSITPKCVEFMWKNLLHPKINSSLWSQEEHKLLMRLSESSDYKNWDSIASQVGNGRTPYLCFERYQKKVIVGQHQKRKWTDDEDHRLKSLVKECRIRDYIPWVKVAYYMKDRTKEQCYQRYTYCLRDVIVKGQFTMEEDFMIIVCKKLFEDEWYKIAQFLPNRTPMQISSRYHGFLNENFIPWTKEEDHLLLQYYRDLGTSDWNLISAKFEGKRTRYQCRSRFTNIYKTYKRNPNEFDLETSMKYDDEAPQLQRKRQETIYNKLFDKLHKFIQKENNKRENLVSLNDSYGGYVEISEGVKVLKSDLRKFLKVLKSDLALQKFKDSIDYDVKNPYHKFYKESPTIKPEKLGLIRPVYSKDKRRRRSPKKISSYELPDGRYITSMLNKNGAHRSIASNQCELRKFKREEKILLEYKKAFRFTWYRQPGRRRNTRYNQKDSINFFMESFMGISRYLQCTNIDLTKATQEQVDEMQLKDYDLFDEFRKYPPRLLQLQEHSTKICPKLVAPKPKVIKTYQRKNKKKEVDSTPSSIQSTSTYSSSSPSSPSYLSSPSPFSSIKLSIMPPNLSTLVGMRSMILYYQHYSSNNKNKNLQFNPSSRLKVGIGNCHKLVKNKCFNENTTNDKIKKADSLLKDRFKSMFFWAGVMSQLPPQDGPDYENLFDDVSNRGEDENDSHDVKTQCQERIAAKNLFDVSEIFRNAKEIAVPKSKQPPPPINSRKSSRVVKKDSNSIDMEVETADKSNISVTPKSELLDFDLKKDLDGFLIPESPYESPPPHPKKRILAKARGAKNTTNRRKRKPEENNELLDGCDTKNSEKIIQEAPLKKRTKSHII